MYAEEFLQSRRQNQNKRIYGHSVIQDKWVIDKKEQLMIDVPKDKTYPPDSVQCGNCGGKGCQVCDNRGWLTPVTNPNGNRCMYGLCNKPLPPNQTGVYCCDKCAANDA